MGWICRIITKLKDPETYKEIIDEFDMYENERKKI
jgi:hypothetical protein